MAIFRVPVTIDIPSMPSPAMNVFHVRTIGPGGDDTEQLTDALNALEEFYREMKNLYPLNGQIRLGEGMIKDPLGDSTYQQDDPRVISTGLSSGAYVSALLAVTISWRTSSASRSGRGRTFIGPLSINTSDADGTPTAAVRNTISSAAVGLVNASTGPSGWSVGVLSVKQGLLRDITGSSVKDKWSYLSSRRD